MAKELIWSENMDYVYGLAKDFESEDDFVSTVKSEYEDGECMVTEVKIQPCIYAPDGVRGDAIIPLKLVEIHIENYYTARVEQVEMCKE